MNAVALRQIARTSMREATLFIFALLLFIVGGLIWQVGAVLALPLLILGLVRLVEYLRFVFKPHKPLIAGFPPLSREDRRVALSKLSKYKARS